TYPNDPDLTAVLIAPDQTEITLFDHVGVANKGNFQDTVFDDNGLNGLPPTPISKGAAPFFGRFAPQTPLTTLNDKLSGGKWTLQIRSTGTLAGKLNSWSL